MGGGEHKNRLGGDIERGGGSGWGGDRKSGVELGTLTGIETVGERKKSGRKAEEKPGFKPVNSFQSETWLLPVEPVGVEILGGSIRREDHAHAAPKEAFEEPTEEHRVRNVGHLGGRGERGREGRRGPREGAREG